MPSEWKPVEETIESHITCPHCGWSDEASWEYGMNDGDTIDIECGSCEKPIRVTCSISVDYQTEVMPLPEQPEESHD